MRGVYAILMFSGGVYLTYGPGFAGQSLMALTGVWAFYVALLKMIGWADK